MKVLKDYPLKSQLELGELNIYQKKRSNVDGPSPSLTIWLQGCPLGCKGCWNPETHNAKIDTVINIEDITKEIIENTDLRSITFSGGEPFWQAKTLSQLCKNITARIDPAREFYFFCYSGLTMGEILNNEEYKDFLDNLHYLKAGRYVDGLNTRDDDTSVSSSNQTLYTFKEAPLHTINTRKFEITANSEGVVVLNGYPPAGFTLNN